MAHFRFLQWLADWLLVQEAFRFEWDNGNLKKSLEKPAITTAEAEEAFEQAEAIRALGEQVRPAVDEPRFGCWGSLEVADAYSCVSRFAAPVFGLSQLGKWIAGRKSYMPNYVKSERGYKKITFEPKKIKAAYKAMKARRKQPTSINLSEETVTELRRLAASRGLPYQTLMRMLVLEGIERLKKAA